MGTPTHSNYCSLRDLLKDQPSPKPKFRSYHSFSKTKEEFQDFYTNMSIDLSILDGSNISATKTPTSRPINGAKGSCITKPADDKAGGPMVEFFNGCSEKRDDSFAENGNERLDLEISSASNDGPEEDAEKEDQDDKNEEEANEVIESDGETEEESGVVESDEE